MSQIKGKRQTGQKPNQSIEDMRNYKFSIVIPVYKSAAILPRLIESLDIFFGEHRYLHEIILVNDGSPDESWDVLQQLKQGRDDLVIVDLLRNYGQHSAVFCGFQLASGDFVITMDDDLQNPPSEIEPLIQKAAEGYDVVFGKFEQKMHGLVRGIGSKFIGWLNVKLFNKPTDLTLTNFRIVRREVVDAVCSYRTNFPYIPGLLLLNGKTFGNVTVLHEQREDGQSNYTAKTIAKLVWRIIFNYSSFPMRFVCVMGTVVAFLAFCLGGFYLIKSLIQGTEVPGWPTLVVLLSFFQGVMLLILAMVGEYLVRLMHDVSIPESYRIRRKM
ncbi:glycosyltransferase family 2 protein [Gimesia chilikensis]|uniref:glycosyltransferase family 2 protein n=1 Tax=Gimesia chilikensis TaxID=2605989 RepID=UPI001187C4FE|nr:glycosyltransferase family 2 protein [Gimesia chilikensis]QDT87619.1 Undecaprenyl-phosphate 4-deoxy-4-formamido-L-arabinose transferase [Gimesia chilikensis]